MTLKNKAHIDWQAIQFRTTIFPNEEIKRDIRGLLPKEEKIEIDKLTTNPKTGEQVLEASYKNRKLLLSTLPIRIDLQINTPNPITLTPPEATFSSLGGFVDVLNEFKPLSDKWLKQLSPLNLKRIAFGTNLLQRVTSVDEGYNFLSRFLPFSVNSREYSEFNLQINKHTKSRILPDLKINRLTKWSVLTLKLELGTPSLSPTSSHRYPDVYMCHLELDINTDQSYKGIFDDKKTLSIFNELIENGFAISKTGLK